MLCDEIGSLATFFDDAIVSAGGCFGTNIDSKTYPTFIPVVPSDLRLADVYLKVVQKFGQVTYLISTAIHSCLVTILVLNLVIICTGFVLKKIRLLLFHFIVLDDYVY